MLLSRDEWLAFLEYKKSGGHLSKTREKELTEFIDNEGYLAAACRLTVGGSFSAPEAVRINKSFSGKKRTVFVFPDDENYIQKFIAYKLLDYDGIFAGNLYSFRRNMGVKKAVSDLMFAGDISSCHSFRLDISDYFNSVDPDLLLPRLEQVLSGDRPLFELLRSALLDPDAIADGKRIQIKKGILAGSPVSGFLANLFLDGLDRHFESEGAHYARYSDDIIVFAPTEEKLAEYSSYILDFLEKMKLTVNGNKIGTSAPGEEWEFLGFSFRNGVIDISSSSVRKLKAKMRRKARALVRWKNKKNAEPERAAAAFIKHFNRKFFSNPVNNEITWARWYFPIINTSESLKEIDAYMQQCIRFIATEKHNKSSYNFTYEQMKKLGYVTLVNSFYSYDIPILKQSGLSQGTLQ